MAQATCGKGHIYDSNVYVKCPYCNGQQAAINFGGAQAEIGKTRPGAGYELNNFDQDAVGDSLVTHIEPNGELATSGIGVTVGIVGPQEDLSKTHIVFVDKNNLNPVVGWIVCVEGPEKGKDYCLNAGINNIGRGKEMDVRIEKDNAISSDTHASIAYDDVENEFTIIRGKSKNINRLNGKPIYSETQLSPYDLLEFGVSKFVFVPFCCDHFRWTAEAGDTK